MAAGDSGAGDAGGRESALSALALDSTTGDSGEVVAGCDKGEGLLVRFSSGLLALLGAGVGSGEVPRACG